MKEIKWIEIDENTEITQDVECVFENENGYKIVGHLDESCGQWWIYEDTWGDDEKTWSLSDFKRYLILP